MEDKALDNNLTLKRKRIMIYFIEAAEKLIRQNGIENLSIRKIATEAGYNSATIYNYFNDLEQLTMFGSICYLREYVAQLEKELKPGMRAIDSYRTIYHCFNRNALRYPEIYHNIFFGKYSGELASVLHLYYHELFPNELENFSEETRTMLVQESMVERDRATMERMVQEGDIQADKAEITLDLIVGCIKIFSMKHLWVEQDLMQKHMKRNLIGCLSICWLPENKQEKPERKGLSHWIYA